MNVVEVKTEADIEQPEQEPPSCEIKHEIPIHIKDEPNDPHNSTCTMAQMDYYNVDGSKPANDTEHMQNFIIYELESPTIEAATTTTTTMTTNHQTPPNILNAKLRKRPKLATTTAQQKKKEVTNALPKVSELKVKCICRLGTADATKQSADATELKRFYEEAFHKTRQLTREQQRSVKMALLDAICEAEQDVDEGKCCANCTKWSK